MTSLSLTPRETELLCGVVAVMKADITWADVAVKANFTTAKQARDKWPAVRDKIIARGTKKEEKSKNGEGGEDAAADAPPSTTKKAPAKKRKAAGEGTPAKGKKSKKSAAAAVEESEEVQVKPEADDYGEGDLLT